MKRNLRLKAFPGSDAVPRMLIALLFTNQLIFSFPNSMRALAGEASAGYGLAAVSMPPGCAGSAGQNGRGAPPLLHTFTAKRLMSAQDQTG